MTPPRSSPDADHETNRYCSPSGASWTQTLPRLAGATLHKGAVRFLALLVGAVFRVGRDPCRCATRRYGTSSSFAHVFQAPQALLKLRLGLFQGRHPIGACHRTGDGERPEPAQMIWCRRGPHRSGQSPSLRKRRCSPVYPCRSRHRKRHQGSLNALIAPPGWPSTTLLALSREAVPALFGVLKLRQYLCSHVRMTLLVWMHVECVPICLVQIDLDRVNIGREGFAL